MWLGRTIGNLAAVPTIYRRIFTCPAMSSKERFRMD